jgi:putative endonuclease
MMYFVYLLQCADQSIYTGITTNVARRLTEHQSKPRGAKYTRAKGVVKILRIEKCKDRSTASKREAEIKKWPRQKKLELIAKTKHRP